MSIIQATTASRYNAMTTRCENKKFQTFLTSLTLKFRLSDWNLKIILKESVVSLTLQIQ